MHKDLKTAKKLERNTTQEIDHTLSQCVSTLKGNVDKYRIAALPCTIMTSFNLPRHITRGC